MAYINGPLATWLVERRTAIGEAEKAYVAVLEIQPMPPPKWVVPSAQRVARMHGRLAAQILSIPLPKGWKTQGPSPWGTTWEEVRAAFRGGLEQASDPFLARARESLSGLRRHVGEISILRSLRAVLHYVAVEPLPGRVSPGRRDHRQALSPLLRDRARIAAGRDQARSLTARQRDVCYRREDARRERVLGHGRSHRLRRAPRPGIIAVPGDGRPRRLLGAGGARAPGRLATPAHGRRGGGLVSAGQTLRTRGDHPSRARRDGRGLEAGGARRGRAGRERVGEFGRLGPLVDRGFAPGLRRAVLHRRRGRPAHPGRAARRRPPRRLHGWENPGRDDPADPHRRADAGRRGVGLGRARCPLPIPRARLMATGAPPGWCSRPLPGSVCSSRRSRSAPGSRPKRSSIGAGRRSSASWR